jgi:peptidoglycan/LPS O-acetylase OafA/YrhL
VSASRGLKIQGNPARDLPSHLPSLDGIRALAVLAVIASHIPVLLSYQHPTPWSWLNKFISGGFLGVDVFFVLSGFLITSLLLKEHSRFGRIKLSHFFARRALRLFPALYVLLAIDFLIAIYEKTSLSGQWNITWVTVLYMNNWYFVWSSLRTGPADFQTNLGHLWSLSVEEQFYLVWPVFIFLIMKLKRVKIFLPLFIILLIALVAIRRTMLWYDNNFYLEILIRTDARLDSLLVGALLAICFRYIQISSKMLCWAAYISLPIFAVIAHQGPESPFFYTFGFTIVALLVFIMIYASVEQAWGVNKFLERKWLTFIGRISYGLYLWHFVVFTFLSKHFFVGPRVMRISVGLLSTFAITLLSWFFIEKPFLRLKDRRFSSAKQSSQN